MGENEIEGLGDFIAENLDELTEESEQAESEETPVKSEQSDAEEPEETPEEESEENSEVPELADTLEGLAEQIELDVDDLKALKTTVEVDGESRSITIGEALEQVSNVNDVTRQSEELAEKTRTFNQNVEQATAVWQDRMQRIDAVVNALEENTEPVDLNYILINEGTEEYLMAKERVDQQAKRLEDAKMARSQALEEDRSSREQALGRHRETEGQLMLKEFPELKEPKNDFDDRFMAAGAAYGFTRQEMSNYMGGQFDVRYVKILLDAHAAKLAKGKQPALQKKLKELPKVRKPGASRGADEISQDKSKAIIARVRKSGGNDQDEIAALFSDFT